jgi:uncharacterized protein DUF3883
MRFRQRGFHYLGNLGSKLADLQGYATLAQELVQNADDVGNAGFLRFDVRNEALVVDNGGVFRSCGQLELPDCPWLEDPEREPKQRRRCDFHRFAWIGSGDKRLEDDTTGAFGIGFLTVYQITDAPELFSAGQHWILNEVATDENRRIEICEGCVRCSGDDLPGTRFVLPWALDPQSPLRRGLRAQAVGADVRTELSNAFRELLPGSMLFLRSLESIQLAAEGVTTLELRRLSDGPDVIVQTNGDLRTWRRLSGSFQTEADALKAKYSDKIETKRSAEVVVAFSESDNNGLLFAWLPTQESSGLSCHIHADFFPTSDRKHLHWEADYRSEWNRAALRAAARAIVSHVDDLKDYIGHERFWTLCQAAKTLADGTREPFRVFWTELLPAVRGGKSVYTQRGEWVIPGDATVVDSSYRDCVAAIDSLGLNGVHEDLDFARSLLTDKANGPGVKILRLPVVNEAFNGLAIVGGTPVASSPPILKDDTVRLQFWTLLERMLASVQSGTKDDRDRLSHLPVAVGSDNNVWSPAEIFRADQKTAELFIQLDIVVPLLIVDEDLPHLSQLAPLVSVQTVLKSLEHTFPWKDDGDAVQIDDRIPLLEWFATRHGDFDKQPALKQRLASLALFPAGGGYRPLSQLSLPGDFEDRLGVAEVIDIARVRALIPFLESLGAKTLSLPEYVTRHVPRALEGGKLSVSLRRDLVTLLAERMGELQDHNDCRRVLTEAPIVECLDGTFVRPRDAYFPSSLLRLVPAAAAHIAIVEREREIALRALYEWLGVAGAPRFRDLRTTVATAVSSPPTGETLTLIRAVFDHLGRRLANEEILPTEISNLGSLSWLPAQGDDTQWRSAKDVAAIFSQDLFASQAAFLDIDREVQNRTAHFMELLGIQAYPTVTQVVRHVRHCALSGIPIKDSVYRPLSEDRWSQDPALEILVGTACIYLQGPGYVHPRHVFWTDPGFGEYRFALSDSLRSYARFLDRVGVRQAPVPADAIEVLLDVAADPKLKGRVIEGTAAAVVDHCWSFLADGFRAGMITANELQPLREQQVIPDGAGMLNRPDFLFLEDRPNLALHFRDSLGSNVIPLPERTAAVMEAAGVRRLSRHIVVEVLEPLVREENFYLANHCKERKEQLRRAAVGAGLATPEATEWARLDTVAYESSAAAKLLVRYRCDALGRVKYSQPQTPHAVFVPDEDVLIGEFAPGGGMYWPDIARELALVIYPDLEPGRVSGVFLQALSPETATDADAVLDALGVPRLAAVAPIVPTPGMPIVDIGKPAGETDDTFVPPAPPPPGGGTTPPADPTKPPHKRAKPRSRYVTYVVPEGAPTPSGDAAPSDGVNRETEEAGVRRVKWSEEAEGRTVLVMPLNNPGYDLESRNVADGEVERYIEVKSLSEKWGADGVGLTATEFGRARELGERYWLYVVERAKSDAPEIYRIQDPARKANWFFFDRGWSQVADPSA